MDKAILLLTLLSSIVIRPALAQIDGNDYQSMIGKAIDTGGMDAHVEKHLRTLGDQGAVEIGRAISDKLLTPSQMLIVLTLVEDSFSDTTQVTDESNRTPRLALLLVRYVEISAKEDRSVERSAAETRKLLEAVSAGNK
jgi:hypothetical protein